MAHIQLRGRSDIDALVAHWRDACLIADGSLETELPLWTVTNLRDVYGRIVGNPLEDQRSFIEKLEQQVGEDRNLTLLAGEVLTIYYLFASVTAVSADTKRMRVNQVLSWADTEISAGGLSARALDAHGIGHPGQYFLLRPDVQLGYILEFAARLKERPGEERRAILADPWRLRDLADSIAEEAGPATMRHILLHLLCPEQFERISSSEHKQSITETFAALRGEASTEDIDEQLLEIRGALARLLERPSEELDFYKAPLEGTWGNARPDQPLDPIDALELKRQLILFGPPGTSKTYEAKQLAGQIIRRHAIRAWTPAVYFQQQHRISELIELHVRRLQLHPAYSYEEFIRGMRLQAGSVSYEDGYLLRLIDEINHEPLPDGEQPLPWVLILDEINRADLSRVMGEAFSVLEDRGSAVELPGRQAGEPAAQIVMPERLYVIGTMNLIDQSLEQIDFALRRRFLWQRSGFDAGRLGEVLAERWEQSSLAKRYPWTSVADEMDRFRDRAALLNDEIGTSPVLGRDYEIGHTYFFDVIGLLERAEYMNRKTKAARYLWTAKHEARPAVAHLWQMSIEPLLDQYLQGVDPETRRAELGRLGRVFLQGQRGAAG